MSDKNDYEKELEIIIKDMEQILPDSPEKRIKILYRVITSVNSVISLIKNEKYFDAYLLVGYNLEMLALLNYMLTENLWEKYVSYSSITELKQILLSNMMCPNEMISIGDELIANLKSKSGEFLRRKFTVDEIIKKITDDEESAECKWEFVNKVYTVSPFSKSVSISKLVGKLLPKSKHIMVGYKFYCHMKHSHAHNVGFCYEIADDGFVYSEKRLKGLTTSLLQLIVCLLKVFCSNK